MLFNKHRDRFNTERSSSTSNLISNKSPKPILIKCESEDKSSIATKSSGRVQDYLSSSKFKADFHKPSRFENVYQKNTLKHGTCQPESNSQSTDTLKELKDSNEPTANENLDRKTEVARKVSIKADDENLMAKMQINEDSHLDSSHCTAYRRRFESLVDENTVVVTNSRNRVKHELSTTYGCNEDTIGCK
jgi:hypothetical protein